MSETIREVNLLKNRYFGNRNVFELRDRLFVICSMGLLICANGSDRIPTMFTKGLAYLGQENATYSDQQ